MAMEEEATYGLTKVAEGWFLNSFQENMEF